MEVFRGSYPDAFTLPPHLPGESDSSLISPSLKERCGGSSPLLPQILSSKKVVLICWEFAP